MKNLITNFLLIALVFTFGCTSNPLRISGPLPGPYSGVMVTDNIMRGSIPSDAQIDDLKAQGFKNYLCLLDSDSSIDREEFLRVQKKWGKGFESVPMNNFAAPTHRQLRWGSGLLNVWNLNNEKSLVTCMHGHERTGAIVAQYRITYQGWSIEDAWKEAVNMGLHETFYFSWKESLIEPK